MDEWYYARGSVQSGPMSIEELRDRLAADGNLIEAQVWRKGFTDWRPAPEVEELMPQQRVPPVLRVTRSAPSLKVGTPKALDAEAESSGKKPLGWFVSAVSGMIGLSLSKML